jgi:hypothetical protein
MAASVTCTNDLACETTIEVVGAPQSQRHSERTSKATVRREVDIANNNLNYTRNHLKIHPDAILSQKDGASLLSIQSVLESPNTLTECIDVSTAQRTEFLLCKLSIEISSQPSALLLLNTMNSSCGKSAFCAYYFIPMYRQTFGKDG